MAELNVKYTKYERYTPFMMYEIELNGNTYDKGHKQPSNLLEGVEEGLNRLLSSLERENKESEEVTVSGVTLNEGTQQYLSDKYTNNVEIGNILFK
ncbi:hypothetical protein JOC34_000386 [Virgibacillus halotolerans]|uniref:hypothetical protein n=1 Tax=Virgibacillus halotolerans TaxID=1071053 RepID=UPI00195F81D2|nr:hypothetical protein [Virgibacillus halotolerans]MBM7598029.1 hypothetical protein [Virgibacillus halotolerans]